MSAKGFHPHDHDTCKASTLAAARTQCKARNLRLTPVRERALEILLAEHRALGAYDLLERLAAEGFGSQPPVVYRALDFLVSAGFVHKVEKLNAYIACAHLGDAHAPAFLICRACKTVAEAEIDGQAGRLAEAARAVGFQIEYTVIEAEGLCPACQNAA